MNNVFYINRPIALKFDLKGASAGRYVESSGVDHGDGGGGSNDETCESGLGRGSA